LRLLRYNTWNGIPLGGFNVNQGGTKGLRGVTEPMVDEVGGVPILDEDVSVRVADIPDELLSYRPTLEGPKVGRINNQLTYTITNFGFNHDYTVSFTGGTAVRNHDIITVVGDELGIHQLQVNDRIVEVEIAEARIIPPTIETVTEESTPSYQLAVNLTAFETKLVDDVQLSTQWEVSTTEDFASTVYSLSVANAPLNVGTLLLGTRRSRVYIRARYQGQELGYSGWSPAVAFDSLLGIPGTNQNDRFGHNVDLNSIGSKMVIGTPGFGPVENPQSGQVSILRQTGSNFTEEATFGHLNIPTQATLTVPAGGEIRVQLGSNPTTFDQAYTSSQVVNLPAWAGDSKMIGKGGPGSQTQVPPVEAVAQQGDPAYPSGLPAYIPEHAVFNGLVAGNTNFSYANYSDWYVGVSGNNVQNINGFSVFIVGPPGESGGRFQITNYERLSYTRNSFTGRFTIVDAFPPGPGSGHDALPTYTMTITVPLSPPGTTVAQQGQPEYPNGLPPYQPAQPYQPGYTVDNPGAQATAVVRGITVAFPGGTGQVPAVLTEKAFYANRNESFGSSVAISGNGTAMVAGAPADTHLTLLNAGSAFVSRFTNNAWEPLVTLSPPVPVANARFGEAVEISDTDQVIFVGAPGENKVYVYKNNAHVATISVPGLNSSESFGSRISCSGLGNRVAIAATQVMTGNVGGKVYIFEETAPNVWTLLTSIVPSVEPVFVGPVPSGMVLKIQQLNQLGVIISEVNAGDNFVVDNGTFQFRLVSSPSQAPGANPPEAYNVTFMGGVYSFPSISTSIIVPLARTISTFGYSMALSKNARFLLVGTPNVNGAFVNQGMVFLYDLNTNGAEKRFIGPKAYGGFYYGTAVAISENGGRFVVSEPRRNNNKGSYDIWTLNTNTDLYERVTVSPAGTAATQGFGISAAISNNGLVHAFGDPLNTTNTGKVYAVG
jgi:hypothetical protein